MNGFEVARVVALGPICRAALHFLKGLRLECGCVSKFKLMALITVP